MAYISQEQKNSIVKAVKAVLPKGWKATFRVQHHMTLVMTVREMPVEDFLGMCYPDADSAKEIYGVRAGRYTLFENKLPEYLQNGFCLSVRTSSSNHTGDLTWVNQDFIHEGATAPVISQIIAALNSLNFDESDAQTDYFNVGYYVDFNFGDWDKPCRLTGAAQTAA